MTTRQSTTPEEEFLRNARNGTEIMRKREDGSMSVMVEPYRSKEFDWHQPSRSVPRVQWHPDTGTTRWQFERDRTPKHQRDVFRFLSETYAECPPQPMSDEHEAELQEYARRQSDTLPSGLPGTADLPRHLLRALDSTCLEAYSPDGQWRLSVQPVRMGESGLVDRLQVRHRDYRTLADWTLLCRLRAWVLEDSREAYIWMPGQDESREGWALRYENATPNNLTILSPRSGS